VVFAVREARVEDDHALARLDAEVWGPSVSPAPAPGRTGFFSEQAKPDDVLVAEVDSAVVGYVSLVQLIALTSHEHVLHINGLAVAPASQRAGVGRGLVEAAVQLARDRGARKLALRVLGPNASARRLYEECGFVVEGILRGEFLLERSYVDDVLMARQLDLT